MNKEKRDRRKIRDRMRGLFLGVDDGRPLGSPSILVGKVTMGLSRDLDSLRGLVGLDSALGWGWVVDVNQNG